MPIFDVRFCGVPTLGATQILGNSTISLSSFVCYLRCSLAYSLPWSSRTKMLLLILGLLAGSFALSHPQTVAASNNPGIPLYLHQLPNNVTISGVQTTHVLNTTTLWDGTAESPNLRYNVFNFTLYPALTSSLTSIGPWVRRPLGHSLGSSRIAERNHLRRERCGPARSRLYVRRYHAELQPCRPIQGDAWIQHQPHFLPIFNDQTLPHSLQSFPALCLV